VKGVLEIGADIHGAVHVDHLDDLPGPAARGRHLGIVLTAAPPRIPEPLKRQIKPGGRLVFPVGGHTQDLRVIRRTPAGFAERTVIPVRFVPMTGEAQRNQ
jgi:protein-L-isoaspartate(D-aspartate) O-methyltransferase